MSDSPKKVLLDQAKTMGLTVDGRWSVEKLAETVMEAQEAEKAAKAEVIEKTSDTWVVLLKDAWPRADERHYAGETICVPEAMAEYWYENTVARPGKPPKE